MGAWNAATVLAVFHVWINAALAIGSAALVPGCACDRSLLPGNVSKEARAVPHHQVQWGFPLVPL